MTQSAMLVATERSAGKTLVCLGLLAELRKRGVRVEYLKPVSFAPAPGEPDPDTTLVRTTLGLGPLPEGLSLPHAAEVVQALASGNLDPILDRIFDLYDRLATSVDLVLCEAVDGLDAAPCSQLDLSLELARNIDARILLLAPAGSSSAEQLALRLGTALAPLRARGVRGFGVLANRVAPESGEQFCGELGRRLKDRGIPLLGSIPTVPALIRVQLGAPRARIAAEQAGLEQEAMAGLEAAMSSGVDWEQFDQARLQPTDQLLTPRRFLRELRAKARSRQRTIVLPESEVDRILKAAAELRRLDAARLVLLGVQSEVKERAQRLGLEFDDGVTIVDPRSDSEFERYVQALVELRRHKGMTEERARELMADRTYFGTMMVYQGRAHGMVSGATTTTAETIRPALEFVKTRPGFSSVSSVFFMCLPDRVLVYGDCAVIPNPSPEQLAEIALASAETARAFGIEPRVAMLSYSTGSSGKGPDVDAVREATRLVRQRNPELPVEGPIQYDAAVDPEVARTKLPDSLVAGRATVFVFPDLNTGNNTYKAVQRSAGAIAIGPILQGLNRPVNDLSRGATVEDIVNTVIFTAIQAD